MIRLPPVTATLAISFLLLLTAPLVAQASSGASYALPPGANEIGFAMDPAPQGTPLEFAFSGAPSILIHHVHNTCDVNVFFSFGWTPAHVTQYFASTPASYCVDGLTVELENTDDREHMLHIQAHPGHWPTH